MNSNILAIVVIVYGNNATEDFQKSANVEVIKERESWNHFTVSRRHRKILTKFYFLSKALSLLIFS